MKLSNFLEKYQVSELETEIALKVHGDVDSEEGVWKDKLKTSVKLTKPTIKQRVQDAKAESPKTK